MVVGELESELGLDACALRIRQSGRDLHYAERSQASGGLPRPEGYSPSNPPIRAHTVDNRALERYFLMVCCGPWAFLYNALSIRSRNRALSMSLMPAFASRGCPSSLWK